MKDENYGLPKECDEEEEHIDPIICYSEFTIAPSDITVYNNNLYVAGLRGT